MDVLAGVGTLSLSAGTVDMNGTGQTIGNLSGNGGVVTNLGGGTQTLTVNEAGTTTFGGQITGGVALTKSGAGILILSGASNYSGVTNISNGTLQLGIAQAIPAASALTIGATGTLARGSFAMTSNSLTLNGGTISGGGAFTLGGDMVSTGGLITGGSTNLGGARGTSRSIAAR